MVFCESRPFLNADSPDVHPVFRGRQHVHLMADEERELRLYAQSIGVPVKWLQRDRFGLPHFDLTGKFLLAVQRDERVTKLDREEFVGRYRALRQAAIARLKAER